MLGDESEPLQDLEMQQRDIQKQEQLDSLSLLRSAYVKVIVANSLYLLYSLAKAVYVSLVIYDDDEYCLQVELWLAMVAFFDYTLAIYFLGAMLGHRVIY